MGFTFSNRTLNVHSCHNNIDSTYLKFTVKYLFNLNMILPKNSKYKYYLIKIFFKFTAYLKYYLHI